MSLTGDLAELGYCTDEWERWQNGSCGEYAVALIRLRPELKFGAVGTWAAQFEASHFFAHSNTWAYDSAGMHRLPYFGLDPEYSGETMLVSQDPRAWDLPLTEEEVLSAIGHAQRNGILSGRYPKVRQPRRRTTRVN